MSDTNKPRRPNSKAARGRSRPPARDPRAEDAVATQGVVTVLRSIEPRPEVEPLPARIAILETELARLKEERETEADDVARMLVRIAAAERAKAAADAELATARATLARAAGLIEEIERREELTTAMRARSLEQARQVLAGETPSQAASNWPPEASTAESNREAKTIEDIERDLNE